MKDERTPSSTVTVQQRNMDTLQTRTVLCAVCLSLLSGPKDERLILRTGDSILSLRPERVLPEVPAYNILNAVRTLVRSGQVLRLYKEEGG